MSDSLLCKMVDRGLATPPPMASKQSRLGLADWRLGSGPAQTSSVASAGGD